MLKVFLFWIFSIYCIKSATIDESKIFTRLNSSEYAEVRKSINLNYLVFFYDPGCRYCQRGKHNIAEIFPLLSLILPDLQIFKVNILDEAAAADSESVTHVPLIILRKSGFNESIKVPLYEKNQIVNTILKSYFGPVYEISQKIIGQMLLDLGESSFVFIGSIDDPDYEELENISKNLFLINTFFLHIEDKQIAKELVLPHKNLPQYILHLAYNDQILIYNGEIEESEIRNYIEVNGRAPILPYSYSLMQEFFTQNSYLLVLFPKERSSESNKLAFAMEEAVITLRKQNIAITSTIVKSIKEQDSDDVRIIEEMIGTKQYGLPLVCN